ncbi:hypothetical protein VM1G_09608 [Cytospora mali]|uniref:Uncharacterized protein n=1 Tax=Cytospora mali TaxID=578113 RepID=A0A194WCQ5_CYTMA|nr:hypothetical protein VM1G_09608 [Valsa mali]
MVSTAAQPDSELFCSAAKTQAKPERHPSTLVPGGHASPLRHPTVLRPGAGQHHPHHHARKSSETPSSQTPNATGQQVPKPIYKAYSPGATPQDPRASVIASEIEGFFTALDVPPLHIQKQSEPSYSAAPLSPGRESPVQRCSSPPVPPKVKFEEEQAQPSQQPAELLQSPPSRPATPPAGDSSEPDCPPAYDESERIPPPPEKAQTTSRPMSSDDNRAASAAVPAAHVAGSVAGVESDEALAQEATEAGGEANQNEDSTEEAPKPEGVDANASDKDSTPPPLPPRATPTHEEIQPDSATHMPGSFPPPPKRSPSPRSSAPQNGATVAAASSATAVGAAVAIPSTDFAHGGLRQARNVLGKHMKHMVDKAKEHHEQHQAKKTSISRAGIENGKGKNILVIAPIA